MNRHRKFAIKVRVRKHHIQRRPGVRK